MSIMLRIRGKESGESKGGETHPLTVSYSKETLYRAERWRRTQDQGPRQDPMPWNQAKYMDKWKSFQVGKSSLGRRIGRVNPGVVGLKITELWGSVSANEYKIMNTKC